jgi:ABC-type Zn uptake system ZnuABC Zn-binding protein ZnuA
MYSAAASVLLLLAACAPVTRPEAAALRPSQAPPLQVVATYSVLGDLVANVGGDQIALTVIVGAGDDPHVYQPTPQDAVALAEADLIFENGLAFEAWSADLYEASGSAAPLISINKGVDLIAAAGHIHHEDQAHEEEHEEAHEEAHEEENAHGEFDPHTWVSPRNAIGIVENIRDALVAADPANAATYTANADAYLVELRNLDQEIQTAVATLTPAQRRLVTSHDIFAYFARDYEFEVLGTALNSVSTEASEPSAATTAALVEEIRAAGVPAIFVENAGNPALMQRIAEEAGVELAPPLYTDALGLPGSGADTYLGMIRTNAKTIVDALQ